MDADKEISSLKKDKAKAQLTGNLKDLAEVCNYLGSKLSERGRYEDALEEHNEELSISKRLGDDLGVIIAHRCIGEVYAEMEMYRKSLDNLKLYLSKAEKAKNVVELQRAWATLGRTYFMKGDLDKSDRAHQMALQLTEKVKASVPEKEYVEMKCRTFLNLALIYDQRDRVNEGCQYYMKAIQLSTKYGLKETLHRCQNSLALFYQKLGYYPRAMKLFDEAIATAKALKSKVFICEYLLAKGYILLLVKDYHGARHYFKKAYATKTPVEDDRDKAKRYLKWSTDLCKSFKALERAKDSDEKIKIYDKLGDIFSYFETYKLAIEYYQQEYNLSKDLEKPSHQIASILVSLAQTYLDDKQYDKAVEHFEKEILERRGNVFEEARSALKIIEAKICQGVSGFEIEELYENALKSADSNEKAKRKILLDYKNYSHANVSRVREVEKMLESMQESDEEDDEIDEDIPAEEFNASEISEISTDSDDDNDNEERDKVNVRTKRNRLGDKLAKRNELGETPLHRACIAGNVKEVEKLLEKGHPVDLRDHCGWLPLHEAANHGFDEIVKLLIDYGSDVNDRGGEKCEGTTPLHDACSNAFPKVIKVLLDKGANVAALDNAGNTPLDCLRIWHSRVEEVTDEEEYIYKKLVKQLEDGMRKVGVDLDTERRRPLVAIVSPMKETLKRPRNRNTAALDKSPNNSPPKKKASNRNRNEIQMSFSNDDADSACHEYAAAISNLRRQKDPSEDLQEGSRSLDRDKDTRALQNEGEFVRDWLVDDVPTRKTQVVRDLYNSKHLPTKYREPSSANSKNKKRKTKRCEKSNSDAQNKRVGSNNTTSTDSDDESVVLFDENNEGVLSSDNEIDCLNDHPNESIDNSLKSRYRQMQNSSGEPSQTYPTHEQQVRIDAEGVRCTTQQYEKAENILVRVQIEDKSFLIKLPDAQHKIEWLEQQTINRFYQLKKLKPVIHLTTSDGALLSGDDLIKDVLVNNEVKAIIEKFEILPLHERYREECESLDLVPMNDIEIELKSAEEQGILNLSSAIIPNKQMKALLDSIRNSNIIQVIDFSYTWISQTNYFCEVVATLTNLDELILRCSGINRSMLTSISRLKLPITHLDLSYNALDRNCMCFICDIVSNFSSLNSLSLISCQLSIAEFANERLVAAVSCSSLKRVITDDFIASDSTTSTLYDNRLSAHQLSNAIIYIKS